MADTIDRTTASPASRMAGGAVVSGPLGNTLVRSLRESTTIFGRNLKKLVRIPMMLFFSLFQPMLWLVLFTQIFK